MPDYNNTVIYKLFCKDPNIKNFYIGYTTDFNGRINVHRRCCNNPANKSYTMRMYRYIRENGGFNNWEFYIIEKYICDSKIKARDREKFWIKFYNPSLNTNN
jgi:predicted GIY-YIG superfamily endonuclease